MPSAACDFTGGTMLAGPDASPFRYPLNTAGTFHFSCSTDGHCAAGQLLTVNVLAQGGSPVPPAHGAQCARFLRTFESC